MQTIPSLFPTSNSETKKDRYENYCGICQQKNKKMKTISSQKHIAHEDESQ